MSWHFSLAAAEELSDRGLLDTELCAQLRSIRIAEKSLCAGKKRGFFLPSLFGTMFEHSPADRGADAWISSLLDSRVNHSALKEKEIGKQVIKIYGPKQEELFPKSAHNIFCSKMCGEYANTCQWSSETCEELAIPSNDLPLLQREAPERYKSESVSGYLPACTARDGSGSGTKSARRRGRGCKHGLNLRDWFRTFFNLVYPPVAVVEYMMQWPGGWTDLKPLAMDKSQFVQQWRLKFFTKEPLNE
jgi:hypothetical protein